MTREKNNTVSTTVNKLKSRLYPRYDLKEIIKLINVINEFGGNASTQAIASHTNKTIRNSSFTGRISSAKQFGLVSLKRGELSLTELAKSICFPIDEESKQRALKQAFSTPSLYKDLIKDYKGMRLPDRTALGNILKLKYDIKATSRDNAAANFINSANYIEAINNDILVIDNSIEEMPTENQDKDEETTDTPMSPTQPITPKSLNKPVSNQLDNTDNFVFPFAGGMKLVIPKTEKSSDGITDGELKEAKIKLKEFAKKYLDNKD